MSTRRTEIAAVRARCDAAPDGSERQELQRTLVTLLCNAGKPAEAGAVLETMVSEGALVWELVDLFELVAAHPGQELAFERLMLHFECAGAFEDAVRVLSSAARTARKTQERARRVRALIHIRFAHEGETPRLYTPLLTELLADVAGLDDASILVCRAVLVRALPAWRAAPTDAAFDDAADAAWKAIDRLRKVYVRKGAVATAARLLERGARLRFDRARQRALLHDAALLHAERLRDEKAAIRLFKQLFEEDAGDPIARSSFDRFSALLEAGGHDAKLAWLLDLRARGARAGGGAESEALECLARAGHLWERASNPTKACEVYARASALGSVSSLEALVRIHNERGRWKDAAAALEHLIARCAPVRRSGYALRLAEVCLTIGDLDRARTATVDALFSALTPAASSAARAVLIEVQRRSGGFRSLAQLLEAEGHEGHGAAAAALFYEAAEVHRTKLDVPTEALRLLERARQADPANATIHSALGEALASAGEWGAVAEVLAEHLSLHGHRRGAELAPLRLRLAEALVDRGRPDDALEQLRIAARLRPADSRILHTRARLELAKGDDDAAERTLRAALVASPGSRDPHERTSRRVQIYVDLSTLAMRRSDVMRARGLLESALDLAIDIAGDTRSIADALRDLAHHDPLARVLLVSALETRYACASTTPERIAALDAFAQAWRTDLDCDAEIGACLRGWMRAVADALGSDSEARVQASLWDRLCSICVSLDDDQLLLGVTHTWAGAVGFVSAGASRARARVALARVASERCGRSGAAIAQLSAAAADDPTNAEASALLVEALERARRWGEAADILERGVALSPDAGPDLAPRIIALRTAQQDEPGLVRALELALRRAPAHREYVGRLVRIYEAREDRAAATRVLRRAVSAAPHDRTLVSSLAGAELRMHEELSCLGPLDAAVETSPTDVELRLLRARVLERAGHIHRALADLRVYEACGGADPAFIELTNRLVARACVMDDVASESLIAAADVLMRAGLSARAEHALEAVLARYPTDVGGLQRLAAARAARGEWARAAAVYERLVDLFDLPANDPATGAFVVAYGDACQRAGRPGAAREALERALSLWPDGAMVAAQLEQTCEAMGAWTRLSELLLDRADRTHDSQLRESLLLRAAEYLERAGTPEQALSILARVRTERPESVEASLRCAGVLMVLDRPREALTVLEPALDGARDKLAALRADLLLEMAKAHIAIEQPTCAFDALATAFSIHRGNREVAMLLGVVAYELGDAKTAERALRAVLKLSSDESTDTQLALRLLASIADATSLDADVEDTVPVARPSEIRVRKGARGAARRSSS